MRFLLIILVATTIGGLTNDDVILVNDTGLPIARIEIDNRKLEVVPDGPQNNKVLISVTPTKHHLKLVFRGGGDVDWPHMDFRGVHEIWFERGDHANNFTARIQ